MCPHCATLYLETMRQVLADYASQGKVCVAYYEFPLPRNQYSRPAARYAVAASRLGAAKWVQVMDVLYYFQNEWAQSGELEPVVAKVLSEKELAQVKTWMKDPKLETWIDRDVAEGKRRGVNSTPTLFITGNGKTQKVSGAVQYLILRRYLENLLAQR
jgi:protein-disulfide isomerase